VARRSRVAPCGDEVRAPHEERNVERRLVREETVRQLAVVSERLAVIGGHDQERRGPRRSKSFEQRRQGVVGGRDFSEIEVRSEARPEGLGGVVGRMRIVDVDPEKARPTRTGSKPLEPARDGFRGARLLDLEVLGLVHLLVELLVDVEARRQTEARVERISGDESAGREARRLKRLRERVHFR
jgi:hypothetical protein